MDRKTLNKKIWEIATDRISDNMDLEDLEVVARIAANIDIEEPVEEEVIIEGKHFN